MDGDFASAGLRHRSEVPLTGEGDVRRGSLSTVTHLPRIYDDLASWWPLLSSPEEYAEEAKVYRRALAEASWGAPRTLLELGSGGGNNAFHMKAHLALTLVDLSPAMLEVSRALNPECEHLEGDMRSVRLDRLFDAVFVHDAVSYLATGGDLRAAFATAYEHCRPGGAALFVPDYVRETFRSSTSHGGHDGGGRGLRYLEWATDPDPFDTTYHLDFAILLREGDSVRVERDHHECGLFGRDEWIRWLSESGFRPRILPPEHAEAARTEMFVALRP